MNSGKGRSTLIGVVGGYLIYLAWQLYQGRSDPNTTMSPAVMMLFIILFVVIGAGLFAYACVLWKQATKDEEQEKKQEENERSLK